MKDKFSVSIKGIIYQNGSFLLRKNQRREYELIGGRFDPSDKSPEERLIKEFEEEAGASINVVNLRDPWLYIIAQKNIIILPYLCELNSINQDHEDIDGGIIRWIPQEELCSVFIPRGYIDSIKNVPPHKSFSRTEGEFFKIIPNYRETDYYISINVFSLDGKIIMQEYLSHNHSPIEVIEAHFDICYDGNFYPLSVSKEDDTVCLNYIKLG